MTNSILHTLTLNASTPLESKKSNKSETTEELSFNSLVKKLGNGTPYSDQTVREYFQKNPTADDIAKQAAKLKLSENEIIAAMHTAGFGSSDLLELKSEIAKFVSKSEGHYFWDEKGDLVEKANNVEPLHSIKSLKNENASSVPYTLVQQLVSKNAQSAKPTDTLSTAFGWGPRITVQQAKDFFATKPSEEAVLQKAAHLLMSTAELSAALTFGRGDVFDESSTNDLVNNSDKYGFDSEGHIVELNGRVKMAQNGNSMLSVYLNENSVKNSIGNV